jgi:thymidylate synthase
MINRNCVQDIRAEFQQMLAREEFVVDKTGVKMLEIAGANFVADEPAIFGKVNEDYVERELDWYRSQSLNVNDIPGGPPAIWKQVADKDGFINSNYGWCIFSEENGNQYSKVFTELKAFPYSRRGVMIYTRPNMWTDYNKNGRSDFMCTNAVQYLIRNDRLHAVVQMRSNDVVFGYKNDYAWQRFVLNILSLNLSVEPGDIHWNAGSLHVYERHFDLIR